MIGSDHALEEEQPEFWEHYAEVLRSQYVRESKIPYYVRFVERFIKACPTPLRQRTPQDLDHFLEELGRNPRLEDWQAIQAVDAFQILFGHLIITPWASRFDWEGWRLGFRNLPSSHPTLARSQASPPFAERERKLEDRPCEPSRSLINRMRSEIRVRNLSIRTEQTYLEWIRRFLGWCPPFEEGESRAADSGNGEFEMAVPPEFWIEQMREFLRHLAEDRLVSAATQAQALNAVIFFCRHVLALESTDLGDVQRPRPKKRLPTVLSRQEIHAILAQLSGESRLMAQLMYGCGLRLMECIRLRIKDIDLDQNRIEVRGGKGDKDRVVPLPAAAKATLRNHLQDLRALWEDDCRAKAANVWIPDALARKYPAAGAELGWQWVFPARKLSIDPRGGKVRRHHVHENGIQKLLKKAAWEAGITRRVSCHTLRHSFATHLLMNHTDIRTIQELMGHTDVSTTMIYTHVVGQPGIVARSPLDD